jgi:hypothetical protein
MKLFSLLSLLLLISPRLSARADSSISMDERNGLASGEALQAGDTLRFPRGFRLPDFSPERGMATLIVKGQEHGQNYACAFAIEADTEVKFPEITHWTLVRNEKEGDVTKLAFVHDSFGALRPLEFRCAGAVDVKAVLMDRLISLPVEVPVEHISDE